MVMKKPPPRPIECGLKTPLQKRDPIAASTALPFLGEITFQLEDRQGWFEMEGMKMMEPSAKVIYNFRKIGKIWDQFPASSDRFPD